MWLWALACSPDPDGAAPAAADPCDDRGGDELFVMQSVYFVRPEAGVPDGFDLDGAVGGAEGCFVTDFTSPGGVQGIDNAFGSLLPALELTEAAAVEGLIQTAIASGELLLTVGLSEVDDEQDDACVDLALGRAQGPPILGTDGLVLSGQTFDPLPGAEVISLADVPLADGVLVAPVALSLPVTIFGVELNFELLDGQLRAERQPDGTLTGVFAGGVDRDYLLSVTDVENVDSGLHDVVDGLLDLWSDLAPDEAGACTRLSIAFSFTAVPAFWYR